MAGIFSEDLKRRVREANDIAAVVRSYGVELKRAGRSLKGLCPFHQEKSPSFNVNQEGQYFKCFGCGKSGDVFTFVAEQERVEFPEAVRLLADRAGIPIEIDPQKATEYAKEKDWKSYLYKLNAAAAIFYREQLLSEAGRLAREYLAKRGIIEAMWQQFGLGYAPRQGNPLLERLRAQRAPLKALERAGLIGLREDGSAFDYFRDRVMFPISDSQNRVIAFGGRVLGDGEPKYLNTRETPLFQKSRTIYGLAQAREAILEKRQAILVEGYTDVIMCHQFGVRNTVAALGTAITNEHVRALRRFADEMQILTDADEAGARASERSLEILFQEELPARIVRLPGGTKDPCDFLLESGVLPFEEALRGGQTLFDFKFQRIATRYDLASTQGQTQAARELLALISSMPDPIGRAALRREVAARLNLPEAELKLEAPRPAAEAVSASGAREALEQGLPAPEHPLAHAERELLRWIFHQPVWLEPALSQVDLTSLKGAPERLLGEAILHAYGEGRLPPSLETLAQEGRTPSGSVAREVLARLAEMKERRGGGEAGELAPDAFERAQRLCIALAEEAPEHHRLKPDEAYRMRIKAIEGASFQFELALLRRALAAAQASGAQAQAEQLQGRLLELQGQLKGFKRRVIA